MRLTGCQSQGRTHFVPAAMPESTPMAESQNSEKGGSAVETKKKTLKKSKNLTWAKEKPQDPFEMLDKLPEEKQQEIQRALHLFSLGQGPPRTLQEARRHTFRFWATQPVPGIDEEVTSCGPVAPETASVREEPYSLPKGFTWDTLDLGNSNQLRELCVLLNENYTEEDDNTLRLHFTSELLLWALCPPGWQAQWHCGVRVHANRKLVGFIGAVPATVQIYDTRRRMAEVNFLCVHKRLRSKRMAPALIREITRRVQLLGTHQAVYSTTAVLPKPVADCRYWHRSLNPRKLVELNVSSLRGNMTLQRALKLNRLPKSPTTAGLRPMTAVDVEAVQMLLQDYMSRFDLRFILSLEEVEHWLLPRDEVIDTYVVESPGGQVTGLVSFYTLSSAVLNHSVHQSLKAAHCFYHVSTVTPLQQLMEDALIIAKAKGFDVFTALDVMENKSFLEPLRFSAGDRRLQYYFYNWKCPSLTPDKVGVVLK